MIIACESTLPIQHCVISDCAGRQWPYQWGHDLEVPEGWYLITCAWSGESVDITRVEVNGLDLGEYIYTSWFQDHQGHRHQPATAMWSEGQWHLWVHTSWGHQCAELQTTIDNGDFGTTLWDRYVLTVDSAHHMDKGWPLAIRSYFGTQSGPRWWRSRTLHTPWEQLQPDQRPTVNKQALLAELRTSLPHHWSYDEPDVMSHENGPEPRVTAQGLTLKRPQLPERSLESLNMPITQQLCQDIGLESVVAINVQTQPPLTAFAPHIDSRGRECSHLTEGPATFIWDLADDCQGHWFRLGGVGMVPDVDQGVWFNQQYHSHATINEGHTDRPLLIMQGRRPHNFRSNT